MKLAYNSLYDNDTMNSESEAVQPRPDWLQVQMLGIPSTATKKLPEIYRRTVSAVHRRVGNDLPTYIERTFRDFWLKRYHQYRDSDRFITRVADVFSLSEARVLELQRYLGLPDPTPGSHHPSHNPFEESFTSCLYLNEFGILNDPVDSFYQTFMRNAEYRTTCNFFFNTHGFRPAESISETDLKFVLTEYRLTIRQLSLVFQVHPDELSSYVKRLYPALPYRPLAHVNIGSLLQHHRHRRLSKLAIRNAYNLYLEQAIPLRVIADRLEIDIYLLFDLAEEYVGEWSHPAFETMVHVLEHCTNLHVQRHLPDSDQGDLFSVTGK